MRVWRSEHALSTMDVPVLYRWQDDCQLVAVRESDGQWDSTHNALAGGHVGPLSSSAWILPTVSGNRARVPIATAYASGKYSAVNEPRKEMESGRADHPAGTKPHLSEMTGIAMAGGNEYPAVGRETISSDELQNIRNLPTSGPPVTEASDIDRRYAMPLALAHGLAIDCWIYCHAWNARQLEEAGNRSVEISKAGQRMKEKVKGRKSQRENLINRLWPGR